MKRIGMLLLVLTVVISIFTGCGTQTGGGSNAKKIKVYTSFYAMYDFATKVGGDKVDIKNIVPSGTEPHDWEPSPSDIVNLENADMFIYSGVGMENWVAKVLSSVMNKKLIVVQASDGLTLIEGSNHSHDEDKQKESDIDPHVWLSIKNAKKQMENIKNAFSSADAENAQYYENNYNRYAKEFDALDKSFLDTLITLPRKDIVVAHQAFGYLCHDYGLSQIAIEGLSPDSEPEPARMAEIIGFVNEHNVKVIFFEELVSRKVAQTIANATSAKTQVLNPLEGLNQEQLTNGSDYISVMKENLAAIKAALE